MTDAPMRLTCDRTAWLTPGFVLDAARAYWGGEIPLDPATEPDNPTNADYYYALPEEDGLVLPWDRPVWLNPPYGRALASWVARVGAEAAKGLECLVLLPGNRWECRYMHDNIFTARLTAMCAVQGRLAFRRPGETKAAMQNPYSSVIFLMNGDTDRFTVAFAKLGRILRVKV